MRIAYYITFVLLVKDNLIEVTTLHHFTEISNNEDFNFPNVPEVSKNITTLTGRPYIQYT